MDGSGEEGDDSMNPPLWVLRQTILPYGSRLPKKRPLWEPPKTSYIPAWGPQKGLISLPGNLANDEYRYWIGIRSEKADWSTCRFCGASAQSKEARKEHKGSGCCKKLEQCYSFLLRDHLCVMCDKRTDSKKWGVPLCSEECETKWKFDSYSCPALSSAKVIVNKL